MKAYITMGYYPQEFENGRTTCSPAGLPTDDAPLVTTKKHWAKQYIKELFQAYPKGEFFLAEIELPDEFTAIDIDLEFTDDDFRDTPQQ
jgi:hypothetical protein